MRETNASVPRGESLAAILPWLDDAEEVRRARVLRRTLAVAATAHLLALALPLVAPEAPAPRVVRLEPFRLAPTPRFPASPPQAPEPHRAPEPPRTRAAAIPVPAVLADPEPLLRPLEPIPAGALPAPTPFAGADDLALPAAPPDDPNAIVDFGAGIEAPVRLAGAAPIYPELARRVRAGGAVVVEATIDREGRVLAARALRGLPFGLTESALAAVESWRFAPARFRGRPIAVRYQLTVLFELR